MKPLAPAILLAVLLSADASAQTITAKPSPRHLVSIVTVTPTPVTVTGNVGARPRDYVIVVPGGTPIGQEDFVIHPWKYLNDKTGGVAARPTTGLTDAVLMFLITKPGSYEARLYRRPDLDGAAHTLIKASPFVVELTPIEVDNIKVLTARKTNNDSDEISLIVEGGTGTLIVPKDTKVTVGDATPVTP